MAVPKRKTPRAKTAVAPRLELAPRRRRPARCARTAARSSCPHIVCGNCGWYRGRQVHRRRVSADRTVATITIAVDAMGGDHAPARSSRARSQAVDELGVRVLLVGSERRDPPAAARRPRAAWSSCPATRGHRDGRRPAGVGADARRTRRSCVAAEARARRQGRRHGRRRQHRRDHGRGAAAHGSHQGRRPARDRGADPGARVAAPQLLVDGGATVDCTAGVARAVRPDGPRVRAASASASTSRRVGLLSNGEEAGKGDELRKERVPAARRGSRASSATSRAATSCTDTAT